MITMDFDDQMRRYFGTPHLGEIPAETLEAGIEHMKVDLGLTTDRNQRFALWALLHTLGAAPYLGAVFLDEPEREAARNFMELMQAASDGHHGP